MKKNVLNYRILDKDTNIDWDIEYAIMGLNIHSMQFENVSQLKSGAIIALNIFYNSEDYSQQVADEAKNAGADYVLYTRNHYVVGYVKLNFNK